MGKVSELSQLIEELNRCGNTLVGTKMLSVKEKPLNPGDSRL